MFARIASLFGRSPDPREAVRPLYDAVVAEARAPHWYAAGQVPDTIDGRFEMVAGLLSLVLLRLERAPETKRESAWLAEVFVTDMDGQLRQIGIGDVVVGKHIGKMMAALGGRLGAYRNALEGRIGLDDVLIRNVWRGERPSDVALEHVANQLRRWSDALAALPTDDIVAARLPASLPERTSA